MDQGETKDSTRERIFHRLRYSYRTLDLLSSNLKKAVPVFFCNRRLRGDVLRFPVQIGRPFVLSLPPLESDNLRLPEVLSELNIDQVRMVISSEKSQQLPQVEERLVGLSRLGVKSLVSLQQQREDVTNPRRWEDFIQEVFSRLGRASSNFEIGTAWNLPGKGVYDHHEYLQLAHAAFSAAENDSLSLVGPGIAGFRSALYPSLLKLLPFDKITFNMQVSQEDDLKQARIGKRFLKNLIRLKAVVETCSQNGKKLWVSDLDWPELIEKEGSGSLIQFLVPVLSTGLVEKIFLPWKAAVGSSTFKTLKFFLEDSIFEGRLVHPEAEIFVFCKKSGVYAVGWTDGKKVNYKFPGKVKKIMAPEGDEIPVSSQEVVLDRHPKYVVFEKD